MAPLTFRLYRRYTFTCLPGYNIAIYPSTSQQRSRAATSSQEIVSYGRQLNLTRNYLQIGSSLLFVTCQPEPPGQSQFCNPVCRRRRRAESFAFKYIYRGANWKTQVRRVPVPCCVLYFDVRRESAI